MRKTLVQSGRTREQRRGRGRVCKEQRILAKVFGARGESPHAKSDSPLTPVRSLCSNDPMRSLRFAGAGWEPNRTRCHAHPLLQDPPIPCRRTHPHWADQFPWRAPARWLAIVVPAGARHRLCGVRVGASGSRLRTPSRRGSRRGQGRCRQNRPGQARRGWRRSARSRRPRRATLHRGAENTPSQIYQKPTEPRSPGR